MSGIHTSDVDNPPLLKVMYEDQSADEEEKRRDQISSNYEYIRQYANRLRVLHHQASGAGTNARDACQWPESQDECPQCLH
jgi:hypothetical protein